MDDNKTPDDIANIDPLENDQLAQDLSDTFDEPLENMDSPDDFSNENWDEGIEDDFYEDTDPVAQTSQKSQINWFNIGVFGFVGVAAIAIGYNQFMGDSASSTPVAQQQQIVQASSLQEKQELVQQVVSDQNSIPNSPQGLLGSPDILADTDNQELVTIQNNADNDLFSALDTPPSYEDDIEDILSTLKQPNAPETNDREDTASQESQINTLPLPADEPLPGLVTNIPEQVELETLDTHNLNITPTAPIETAQIQEEQLSTPDAAPQLENSDDLNAITSQVEAMDTRLNDLTSRMDQIMVKLDAEPAMSAPTMNNDAISKMENTISTLEKRIETLSKAKAPVKRQAKKAVTTKKEAPKISKPKIVWELRGASPEQAYVAQRGTQNLRTVAVGETLDGIGRVTSIAIENNRWIVRGTSGVITQ
jgi:hypothetical protein